MNEKRLLALEETVKEFCEKFRNDKKLESWVGTFEIMVDKKAYESLNRALKQVGCKRIDLR